MRTSTRAPLNERLRAVPRDSQGSVATIFAVALVPVMIAAGIGIDMSRAMSSRSNLQDALDATGLALAHLPPNTDRAALEAKAATWLNVNLSDGNMSRPVLTVVKTNGQVVLSATSKVQTTLTAIAGYRELPISASTTVKWGLGKVEVALVLDNTGSMAGVKLTRLKEAATELVETLESQVIGQPPDTLKIGVVPFSTAVRLSSTSTVLSTYRTATWMSGTMPTQYGDDLFVSDTGAKLTNVNRFTTFDTLGTPWGGCVESRPAPFDVQDTAPATGTPATMFVPYFAPDEPDEDALEYGNTGYYYQSYNDYLADERDENYARTKAGANTDFKKWMYLQGFSGKYDEAVSSAKVNNGLGPNAGCNMQALVRLTNNMTTVKSKITAMNATGNTNIPIGLMWGWHVLSPNLPFADGVSYSNPDTKKFIVLLTDGDNVYGDSANPSRSLYTALGYAWQKRLSNADENASQSVREARMDDRMGLLCTNMKSAGITVFAVRIDVAGTAPAALSGCASSTDKFYDIDSTGLSEAFQNIAGSIGRLRIAQ